MNSLLRSFSLKTYSGIIYRVSRVLGASNSKTKMNPWMDNRYNNYPYKNQRMVYDSLMMKPPPPPPLVVNCGELRKVHEGKYVEITGKYGKKRLGRFAELRDRAGATQLVICEERVPRIARRFANMPPDSILTIVGQVLLRPISSRNQTMPTGDIEVEVEDILNYEMPINRKAAQKRSYSTMMEEQGRGITSTEYKMAQGSENILKHFDNRDYTCNDLRTQHVGKIVQLVGWLPSLAKTKFQQLKDGHGQTQIVVEDERANEILQDVSMNSVILVKGRVVARPVTNINMKYDTGEIEVIVEAVKILDPNEAYDGPIREKPTKMDISDNIEDNKDINKDENDKKIEKIADTNKFTYRTYNCGEVSNINIGEKVTLCGWVEFQRMKKFLVLRDGYGQVQVLIPESLSQKSSDIPLESVIKIEGVVTPRPTNMRNPAMKTGDIEIQTSDISILNLSKKNLPMEVKNHNRAKEALRMEHRYIDLRFPDMQRNLRLRSSVLMKMREYLINYLGFIEVETPTLFRRTPGGAQEFIVPTRKPGHFYSLVQSPQQFKQMLMVGAIDRYFQIARCYRDETTRADRQPEFTQLDIELSFTTREDIMHLIEETLSYCWPSELGKIQTPFPTMTYEEAISKYGSDKPDTRFDMTLEDVTELIEKHQKDERFSGKSMFVVLAKNLNAAISKSTEVTISKIAKGFNCKFIMSAVRKNKIDWIKDLEKALSTELLEAIAQKLGIEKGDVMFLAYGDLRQTQLLLGRVRAAFIEILEEKEIVPKSKNSEYNFLWVTDFPLFIQNEETQVLESAHHPFTAPHIDDNEKLNNQTDLTKIRSQAYDLVLNGQEIGGGSMRIHDRNQQLLVLEKILKIDYSHMHHLLEALQSGCPPHGGIALGIDRLLSIMCATNSIRDVIAFPKGMDGKDHLSKAPVPISNEEKELYHLEIRTNSAIKVEDDESQ